MTEDKLNILLVEDDQPTLKSLDLYLSKMGMRPYSAQNAEEAMECVKHQSIDLAILDSKIGKISGLELAKWLKENTSIPFIFLSGYTDSDTVDKAVENGAFGYMIKPVDMNQLRLMIESAVKRGEELIKLKNIETQLSTALENSRNISMAVGIIMERYKLSQNSAFDKLRQSARSKQAKLDEVAKQIVQIGDVINSL